MRVVAASCLVLAVFGCSESPVKRSEDIGYPEPEPSPHLTILRLIASYEQKKTVEYQDLFTTDFTFEFSTSTDPDLVIKYQTGWFKADESASSAHLFQGYTPQGQPYAPPASSINIDLANTYPVDDNSPGLNPRTHKFLFTRVDGEVVIPTSPDPTTYLIANNTNVFYIVRGDQASLNPGQPADSAHWYIYRWVDLTVASSAPRSLSPQPGQKRTWASLKAAYR